MEVGPARVGRRDMGVGGDLSQCPCDGHPLSAHDITHQA